ncbi:MAG: beta-N-acetylhexosaminidase [Bryobacteraceae bacterium]
MLAIASPSTGASQVNLMPMPAKIVAAEGRLSITQTFSVAVSGARDARVTAAVRRLIPRLSLQTGIPILESNPAVPSKATLLIHCARTGAPVQNLAEDESYRLEITATQARLSAPNAQGVLHGMETFLQLVESGRDGFATPAVTIEDKPRFPWRGLHLDVSRHWMPMHVVLRNLDGMAAVKLNVFHWHLSDDQGFRIESKRYPKLHELGSDGHYYTQEQVRQVLAYARDRGIRVVPEFDMPAHSSAWLVGYPELASGPGPFEIGRTWGIFIPTMDPTRETTYSFLDGFIGEMARLFSDEYFHIGGDEVNGRQWDANTQIGEFKKQHGFDNHALQASFNRRIQEIVKKHGKRMEGWDEVLDPALPKDIVIQSWRGPKSLVQAARLGYDGILSSGYYLDLMHSAAQHYAVDPLDKESGQLTADQQKHILGGEAAMWAEFVTPENVDSRLWPRTAAIAERLWSPREIKDPADMYRRLDITSQWLEWSGLKHRANYYLMLQRLAGPNPVEPVKTLAAICEPIKEYSRSHGHTYTQQTPLNRMVDTVQPESDRARHFAAMNLAGQRTWLIKWRDNDARLRPLIGNSSLLSEVAPVSANISRLAGIGLKALDYLASAQRAPSDWVTEQRAFINSLKRGEAELLISITPVIDELVTRSGSLAPNRVQR